MNPLGIRPHHFLPHSLTESPIKIHAVRLNEGSESAIAALEACALDGNEEAVGILMRFLHENPESTLVPIAQQSIENAMDSSDEFLERLHAYFKPDHLENDDLVSQYVHFLVLAIPQNKHYLKLLLDLANTEKREVFRTLKTLSDQGNPTAKVISARIEYEYFMYRSSLYTIQSQAFDHAYEKWLMIADLNQLRCEDFILYLLPPHLRLSWFEGRPKMGSHQLHFEMYEVIENDLLHAALVMRISDLLEHHPNPVIKERVATLIVDWLHIVQWNLQEESPHIFRRLVIYPQISIALLTMLRSRPQLKSELSKGELHRFERNAVNVALQSKYDEQKSVLRYLLNRCRQDYDFYGPLYVSLIVHYVRQDSREWESLLHLAFCGVPNAIACIEEMVAAKNLSANYYYKIYQLMQWMKTHDLNILADQASVDSLVKQCTDSGWKFVLSFFENPRRPRNTLYEIFDRDTLQQVERDQKRALVILIGVQRFDFLIPSLTTIALQGQTDALKCLQELAEANRGSAVKELAKYAFKEFVRTCNLRTLRSHAFDQAIESAAAHQLRVQDYALSIYLLPHDLRLAWQEELTDPEQSIMKYLVDRSLETNFSKIQEIPHFLDKLIENIACKLTCALPPSLLRHISLLILDHQYDLGLHDEHPVFQKAIEILAALEVQGVKNPARICQKLMQLKQTPCTYIPPFITVENKALAFDLSAIQRMNVTIPKSALHSDVTWNQWELLILQIQAKLADPAVAKCIQNCTIGGFRALSNSCLNDIGFFKPRIEFQGSRVPLNFAQLNAILHKIFNLNDTGYPLSPKEQALITFAESVKNCEGGKFEGVSLFYANGLEPHEKFPMEIPGISDPAIAKARSTIAEVYQHCLSDQFCGTNALMQELTNDPDVNQAAHQSIYLKNLIGHIVGLQYDLHFDMNTGMLYNELIHRTREEVLEVFFKHFTPQTLIDHVHAWMVRDSELPGRKNWDKVFTLAVPDEEDMLWDPETDLPLLPTKNYARKVLVAIGLLKEM